MRALLVAVALAAGVANAPSVCAMTLAPKPGDAMTQSELLTYLFAAPQSGDWLRYRVSLDGSTILTKTIGFGAERFGSDNAAFFEIQTQSSGAHCCAGGEPDRCRWQPRLEDVR